MANLSFPWSRYAPTTATEISPLRGYAHAEQGAIDSHLRGNDDTVCSNDEKKALKIYILRALRGTKQSRTAVHGFADRCLTTRPWYHKVGCKDSAFFEYTKNSI